MTALAAQAARLLSMLQQVWPGVALAGVIAMAATFVSTVHGGPQMLYALFFGVAFHHLAKEPRTAPGVEFCARGLLRLGVGLLGARITATQIAGLGWVTAGVVVVAVVSTILVGQRLARALGMERTQGLLSGGSVAICGASAALAISAVLPRSKDSDRFTLLVVVTVTALSTIAMVLYPLLARLLHLPPELAGLFIGGTIHDVAQVVGAGYTLGQQAGDTATIVKLFRVALLAVVVVVLGAVFRAEQAQAQEAAGGTGPMRRQPLVPWFLWLFLAMVAVNSAGWLDGALQGGAQWLSRGCLVIAIAALGVKTSFQQLAQAGWKPMALILAETLWLAALVLAAIGVLHWRGLP